MRGKITLLSALIISLICVSCVFADNNTASAENMTDTSNYIMPVSVSQNGIEFSDGFTGFMIDSSKNAPSSDEGFVKDSSDGNSIENYVKLAIIECYKAGRENDIAKIVSYFADGSYASSDDEVVNEVLKSNNVISDYETVSLEDSIEGRFTFELLKSSSDDVSDCLAYTVSLKEVENEDVLSSTASQEIVNETYVPKNNTQKNEDVNKTDTPENTAQQTEDAAKNNTQKNETYTENSSDENITPISQETINMTVNENNTTIINQNISKTNETPENSTAENQLLKTVGNPVFILVLVIVIALIITFVIRRKD